MPKAAVEKKKTQRSEVKRTLRVLSPPLISRFQHTVKRSSPQQRVRDKFDILRPEVLLEMEKKTNFHSVQLDDTPEGLQKRLQLAERRQLKEEKLHLLKQIMVQFRQGKFF